MMGGHDGGTMTHEDKRLQPLANSIRSRSTVLDALAQQLRTPAILEAFDKWNHHSWCTAVAGDSLGAWAAEICRAHEIDRLASRCADLPVCAGRRCQVESQKRPEVTLRHRNRSEFVHLVAFMPLA